MMELQEKVNKLRLEFSKTQQRLISLESIQNFLISYEKLNPNYKHKVHILLLEYFTIIELDNYNISKEKNKELTIKYILGIGKYYAVDLGFKLRMSSQFAFIMGLLIDSLLLIAGVLKRVYYMPVATSVMLTYWAYLKIFYENKSRVYGHDY